MSEEEFWDITPAEFTALQKRKLEAEKSFMRGFQFSTTMICRALGADVDFMEPEAPQSLLSLDSTEVFFEAMAKRNKDGDGA